jgi:serine/threonine protein kinase/Tfp pilus assembly protein PilF
MASAGTGGVARPYAVGDAICDDYVVRLPLGEGGMGEVYLVEHSSSGDLRAAKVMRTRDSATSAALVGFRQEALSLLNVGTHPFVVQLFDIREEAKDIVLLMEYVAPVSGCTTVEDFITRNQDYNDRLIGAWAVQFCVGMEHALTCGIAAHRDIKPTNLLIGSGAFLKIADFGLALAFSRHPIFVDDAPKRASHLQWLKSADGRRTCGTPGYVAPELFFGGKASPKSDMFSFGVTLWQLAARSSASPYGITFNGDPSEYQYAILEKVLAHDVERIESPYFGVIRRCLAPDPAERYTDFPALREAIKSAAKFANVPAMDFIVAPGFRGRFEDYVNRGRSYLVLGRYERAQWILDEAVKHDPNSHAALVARAEALTHRGELVLAIRAYEDALGLDPEAVAPLTGIAFAWLELGRPAQARAALDQVLSRQPSNLDALLLLARVLSTEGDHNAALKGVESVIAADPKDWRAHEYRGRALWSLERLVDAAGAFGACLRINPLALDARLALASVLTAQRELGAAETEYHEGIRLFRENPEALNKLAAHMAEHEHEGKAIELFKELADSVPGSRSIMMVNIGNAQLRKSDRRAAAISYKQAIETDPSNALAFSRLGELERDNGRVDKAADFFARACELDSNNSAYQASAGTTYLQQKDHKRAATYLRRSVEMFPEQPLILYNLAVALLLDGNEEAAVAQLTKAVHIEEGYGRGWYLKAKVEEHLGRTADAVASAGRAAANDTELSAQEREGVRALLGK